MKKIGLLLILFIFFITGCRAVMEEEKKVFTTSDASGKWYLFDYTKKDTGGSELEDAYIEFSDEGCLFYRRVKLSGGSTIVLNDEGKCYLNGDGSKFKMEKTNSRKNEVIIEWSDYKKVNDLITIGEYKFSRNKQN